MTESTPPDLPEWLVDVPMNLSKQTPVFIEESGKYVSANLLMGALEAEIGKGIGVFSMPPELAQRVAELTENSNWKNLAPEPTLVTRKSENEWEIRVGDFTGSFGRESIVIALDKALKNVTKESDPEQD